MTTINGTSGNDTLTTNLYTDDDFFGFAGNDIFEYELDGYNDTITDSSGNDELAFGTGISRWRTVLTRMGDDLVVRTYDAGEITIKDHFLSSSDRVETISYDVEASIDLTDPDILVMEAAYYNGAYHYQFLYGTNPLGQTFYGGTAEADAAQYGEAWIFGNEGADTFYVTYGVFHGSGGNDTFYGWNAMHGDDGDDTFYIIEGNTYLGGGTAFGGDGNDTVYGHSGVDYCYLDDGDDLMYGNDGNDIIMGGDGNDTIYGGDGDDWIASDYNAGAIVGPGGDDIIHAGDGNDGIDPGSGNDIIYAGDGDDGIYGGSGSKEIYGEGGNDGIAGGDGSNIISGGDGDDMIWTYGTGTDVVHGDDGNDYIQSSLTNGTFTAYGDAGNDIIYSSTLYGNMYGGSGNDTMYFGGYIYATTDMYGGTDNDTYINEGSTSWNIDVATNNIYDDGGAADSYSMKYFNSTAITFTVSGTNLILTSTEWTGIVTIIDQFTSAHRIESFVFANDSGSLFETLNNSNNNYTATNLTSPIGSHQNFIEALGGIDTINAGIGDDFVWGGTGNDTLNGNADNDTLYGEDDDDTLRGGAGDDILDGGSGYDTASYSTAPSGGVTVNLATGTATGADGTDTLISMEAIVGSSYADNLTGDTGSNRIEGGNGNDTIYGGDGWDYLYGGNNNDTIYGEGGNDTLYGGAGNDIMDGGADDDMVDYTSATTGITLNLSLTTNQVTGQGTDKVLNIENFNGSNYADTVTGTSGTNLLNGGNGNDTLNGGDGNDTLYGGADNDTLNGGNHDDSLSGGTGDDTMDGGSGTDYVRYFGSAAAVTVNLATGTATGEGTDTITNVENVQGSVYNDTITGSSIDNRLEGFDGNDSLYGGDGFDVLLGGYGADTFTFKGETAFNNVDQIWDYTNGTGGDYIDIADVLSDFGYNSLTDTLSDWVATSYSGGNTLLQVDRDGTGGTYSMASIVRIDAANLSLTDLTTDGNLIT